jgi:hypothetical protein
MGYILALAKVIRSKWLTFISLRLTFIAAEMRRELLPYDAPELAESPTFSCLAMAYGSLALLVSKRFPQGSMKSN